MNWQDRGAVCVVVLLSVLAGMSGTAVASDDTTATQTADESEMAISPAQSDSRAVDDETSAVGQTQAQTENTITVEQEYRLTPNQPGRVDVQWQFTIPENVPKLSTKLPSDATNPRRSGFRQTTDGYVWTESEQSTRTPTLTYTTSVNQTGDVSGPIGSDGRYLFVDAGDWALIEHEPSPGFDFSYYGERPTVERTNTTAGEGVVGQSLLFLGPYDEYTRSAHDQKFRLVVPNAATLSPSRKDVFDTVTDASARLQVGDRDRQVLMFVAPNTVPWGVRGLQSGDRNFYAVADEPVDDVNNVWIHEYVHTRQDFETTAATRWTTEASAEYYASFLTLEQGRIPFSDFRQYLSRGADSRFSDVVLSNPTTWTGTGANYYTGALVMGELDRRLRVATDRTGTLQGALRRFNQQSTAVSQADFLGYVGTVGGTNPQSAARRYTETTDRPSLWSQQAHETAFEPLPAQSTTPSPTTRTTERTGKSTESTSTPGESGAGFGVVALVVALSIVLALGHRRN